LAELARVEIAAGQSEEAASTLAAARRLHEETGERATDLNLTYLGGDAHVLTGDLVAAEFMYQQTLTKCREGESEEPRVWAYLGLARVARARGKMAEAESLISAAVQICERVKLGKILPRLRLEQVSLRRETGQGEMALQPLSALRELFTRWESHPGLARCDLLEAGLRWEVSAGEGLPAEAKEALRQGLEHAVLSAEDTLPFLREEPWIIDLLIGAIKEQVQVDAADALLARLGPLAVPPLIESLRDRPIRLPAIRLLGRLGDPRARRPLTRLLTGKDREVRRAAEEALVLLREPEPVALRVFLFGRFEVFRGKERIAEGDWKTQKVKALLKYLLLHRDHGVHQDRVIDLLWPEREARAGAVNLKAAVKNLRQALEPLLEGTRSHFILREGQTLRFHPGAPCWVDLDEYRRHLEEARRHEGDGRVPEAIGAYEQAVALYRGDLLGEDLYEDWTTVEWERWRGAQIDAVAALARLHAGQGDFPRAVEFTQRVLELDRLREAAYRDLIRYSLQRGDRHTAIRAFRTCERLLREELGVTPEPETLALYEQATAPV
jgi:DNA-binding SARP family transcriptional activator